MDKQLSAKDGELRTKDFQDLDQNTFLMAKLKKIKCKKLAIDEFKQNDAIGPRSSLDNRPADSLSKEEKEAQK